MSEMVKIAHLNFPKPTVLSTNSPNLKDITFKNRVEIQGILILIID